MKVINLKPPARKPILNSLEKYKSHPCRHYMYSSKWLNGPSRLKIPILYTIRLDEAHVNFVCGCILRSHVLEGFPNLYTFNEEGLLRWHPTCPFCTGESCLFRHERNCFPLACCHVSFLHWLTPFESHVEMTFHYYLVKMKLSVLYKYSHPRVYFLAMNWTSWLEMNAYVEMVDEASIHILCTFDSRR